MGYSAADLAYVRASFRTLDELCADRAETPARVRSHVAEGRLPAPSYVLPGDVWMFPTDYFELVDAAGGPDRLREHFAARWRGARPCGDEDELDDDWRAYMAGVYGVCLREVTPETIVRKSALVSSLCELLVLARPGDPEWRQALRAQVDELDSLEREFAPDYDRDPERFGRPPTRDLLVEAARERYPAVFVSSSARPRSAPAAASGGP